MDRIAFFREHLEKAPTDRFARYSLALELKKAGQLDAAEAELRTLTPYVHAALRAYADVHAAGLADR